ncbi:tetratricopeptide repeat protein [Micromonospora sp. NPDC051141]|uniref:tetratricopeptide repeat protein n=1 Tax=Micromonospora sp. NPDC051141 TaxID=3364284 RepID=UPI00379F7FA5
MSEAWEAEILVLWQRLRAPAETSGRGAVPSLRAVAARSGYSVGFLSEVLRGRKRPSPDAAAAIAEALGGTAYDVRAARTYAERMRDSPVPRPPAPTRARVHRTGDPHWPCRIGVVPHAADCWQRRPISSELAADSPGTASSEPTSVLTGLGGVGKTQVAVAHALDLWTRGALDMLVWANAAHRHGIVAAYAQAAQFATGADQTDDTEAARRFLAWAASTDRRWLVVLDDLAAPGDIADLWPPNTAHGRTLVTTRRRDAALAHEGRRFITVQPFTPAESMAYLTKKFATAPQRMPGAAQLANDLGHLPVAMGQAAAYIQDRGLTCQEYRRRLTARLAKLADLLPEPDALPDDYHAAVSATWSLSVRLADRLRPKGLARPLLDMAAWLDPNGIPVVLFEHAAVRAYLARRRPTADLRTGDASDALGSLHRLNLVTVDDSAAVVRVHALVQRATRDGLGSSWRRHALRAAADALNAIWLDTGGNDIPEEVLHSNALALHRHADDQLVRDGVHPLLFRATTSLGRAGHVAAAVRLAQWLNETASRLLGEDHPDTLAARGDLAFWRGEAGAPSNAAAAAQRLVADCRRALGPRHRQTLNARHHAAGWHGRAGAPQRAVAELSDLLADRIRILGPDDPDTLNNRNSLAGWLGYAGDPRGAVAALRSVLMDRVRILGDDHTDTLDTRHHLAHWLGEAGDPAAAAAAFESLLDDRRRVLGAQHRDTLATRYRLARWRAAAGDSARALRDTQQLVEDCREALGTHHPDTLTTEAALAELYGEQGNPQLAVALLKRVLTDRLAVLERNHPDIARTRERLARWTSASTPARGAG